MLSNWTSWRGEAWASSRSHNKERTKHDKQKMEPKERKWRDTNQFPMGENLKLNRLKIIGWDLEWESIRTTAFSEKRVKHKTERNFVPTIRQCRRRCIEAHALLSGSKWPHGRHVSHDCRKGFISNSFPNCYGAKVHALRRIVCPRVHLSLDSNVLDDLFPVQCAIGFGQLNNWKQRRLKFGNRNGRNYLQSRDVNLHQSDDDGGVVRNQLFLRFDGEILNHKRASEIAH